MVIASTLFIPYFNWKYAQENGFVKWILLGEIVPTMKAVAWPYFIVADRNAAQIKSEQAKAEERYEHDIAEVTQNLGKLENEQTVLAGKVIEREQNKGQESALTLLANETEKMVKRQRQIIDKMESLAVPEKYKEFHRLMLERQTKQNGWMIDMVKALRTGDTATLKSLKSEEEAFEKDWRERITKVAQDAGMTPQ